MKVLETAYRGHRFRSRLEARWAVFYDTLGIPFIYEPEGYALGPNEDVPYLPDFYLPEVHYGTGCYVEIKGDHPTQEALQKAQWLTEATSKPVFVFWGDCSPPSEGTGGWVTESGYVFDQLGSDVSQWWCECHHCKTIGLAFRGRAERLCECHDTETEHISGAWRPRLLAAYEAAASARFGT